MCLLKLLINNSLHCSNPQPYTYTCIIQQQIHIYKYVQSCIVNLHQYISVTPLTIIRMVYYKNTINIQIIVQKYIMLHLICKSNITRVSKIKCTTKWFYSLYLYTYLYIDCILIISHLSMVTEVTEACW